MKKTLMKGSKMMMMMMKGSMMMMMIMMMKGSVMMMMMMMKGSMMMMMMEGSMMMMMMMMITYQLRRGIPHRIRPVVPLRFLYHENGHLGRANDVVATTMKVLTCDLIEAHVKDITCNGWID
jgi:hypothetical protein